MDRVQAEAHDSTSTERPLPLTGLRVLDFGHTIMGPSCGLVLADLGADVIRIEPAGGDRTRHLGGFAAGFFGTFNRNKKSLSLDLKSEAGLDILRRLIPTADVLIENFAPGTMERLGLGWEALQALNHRLVYCALKGYLPGPYEHLPALDEVVQMQAGLAYMTGPPGEPLRAGTSVVDIMGGVFGSVAILAALRERESTGRGGLVRSALFESTAFLVAQHMAGASITGEELEPMARKPRGAWYVYTTFQTADAPIFIGITSETQWLRFCDMFDASVLRDTPALATHAGRLQERDLLHEGIATLLAAMPSAEVLRRCRAALIPCAPIAKPTDLLDDPHLNAGGGLLDIELAPGVQAKLPALPIHLNGSVPPLRTQPPRAGQNSVELLQELGFNRGEIANLIASGVVFAEDTEDA